MIRLAVLALVTSAFLAPGTTPCIHPPRGFDGSILQSSQAAIIFWREGREELILKIHYETASSADKEWKLSKGQKARLDGTPRSELYHLMDAQVEKFTALVERRDVAGAKKALTLMRAIWHRMGNKLLQTGQAPGLPTDPVTLFLNRCINEGLVSEDSPWVMEFRYGTLPEKLAWVVPVPNVPDGYGVVDPRIFSETDSLFPRKREEKDIPRGPQPSSGSGPEVRVVSRAKVGEYDIQGIQASGEGAARALNEWLKEQGFGEVSTENMKYYVDRGWTFLAIRIDPEKGKPALGANGEFRPLRISFAADRIYYPLKFSSHQGEFDITAYVFTETPVSVSDDLLKKGVRLREAVEVEEEQLDSRKHLSKLMGEFRENGMGSFFNLYLAKIGGTVNGHGNHLEEWERDFEIIVPEPGAFGLSFRDLGVVVSSLLSIGIMIGGLIILRR